MLSLKERQKIEDWLVSEYGTDTFKVCTVVDLLERVRKGTFREAHTQLLISNYHGKMTDKSDGWEDAVNHLSYFSSQIKLDKCMGIVLE